MQGNLVLSEADTTLQYNPERRLIAINYKPNVILFVQLSLYNFNMSSKMSYQTGRITLYVKISQYLIFSKTK